MKAQEALHAAAPSAPEPSGSPVYQPVPGETGSSQPGAATTAPMAQKRPPAPKLSGIPPLPAPPSPLSVSKEQRLQELLQLYRADKITPEEYHVQRAKILAEP